MVEEVSSDVHIARNLFNPGRTYEIFSYHCTPMTLVSTTAASMSISVSESKMSVASPAPRRKLSKLKRRKYNWAPLLFNFVTLNLSPVDFIIFFLLRKPLNFFLSKNYEGISVSADMLMTFLELTFDL